MEQWLVRSTSDLLIVGSNPSLTIFFLFFSQKETRSECTARVKLELTAFSGKLRCYFNIKVQN